MMYKNTFKLLISNFTKVWRVLLHLALTLGITIGLGIAVAFPIYKVLLREGVFTQFSDIYMEFVNHLNLPTLFASLGDWLQVFVQTIMDNISSLLVYIILLVLIIFVVGNMLVGSHKFAVASSVNYYMNSSVNNHFTAALVTTARSGVLYHLLNIVILLPINIGIACLVVMSLNLLTDAHLMFWAPFIAMLIYSLLTSLKIAIFGGWIPAMVVKNKNVFGGLKECFRVMGRRFIYTFGSALAMTLTLVFVNVFGGLCTFGVGLILTIPASCVTVQIFNMVAYYTAIGQRYYVDANNVCAPKRQEFTDKFNDHKYII